MRISDWSSDVCSSDLLPLTMLAIEITEPGGPEMLKPGNRPVPAPAADEVLVKVAFAGVNRPDVAQRSGGYPPPPGASDIPGLAIEIGRASCRERVCQYVEISVVAGTLKKKNKAEE